MRSIALSMRHLQPDLKLQTLRAPWPVPGRCGGRCVVIPRLRLCRRSDVVLRPRRGRRPPSAAMHHIDDRPATLPFGSEPDGRVYLRIHFYIHTL